MSKKENHIPFIKSITDFFELYGIGKPLNAEVMCMKLEEQPDSRLLYMPLYRANFYRIIHFINADITNLANEKKQVIAENSLVFSFPSKLESWERKGKLYGNVIYFTAEFADLDFINRNFISEFPYFDNDSEVFLPLTLEESTLLNVISDEMITEINSSNIDKLEFIKKLLQLYLHKIRRIYQQKTAICSSELKRDKQLFNRFRKEIDSYFQQLSNKQRTIIPSVSILADILSVSPNYLNAVIKNQTGKTASSYIQEKMILEAKSYLIHTQLQVVEIAFCLGFENVPYFNRFFKKMTQKTPLEFRNSFFVK